MPPFDDLRVSPDLKEPLNLATPPLPRSNFGTAIAEKLPAAMQTDAANAAEVRRAGADTVASIDRAAAKTAAMQPPVPPPTPKPPEYQSTTMGDQWGSVAMAFAMLGSAFTRRPLVASLNAGAEVMKAFQKRDSEGYKRSFENWKAQTEYTQKAYEYQRDAYKDALELIQTDPKTAMTRMRAVAAAFGDSEVHRLAEGGKVAEIQILDQQRTHTAEEHKQKAERAAQEGQITGEIIDAGKSMQEARQSGDPARIAAAQQRYQIAQQAARDFAATRHSGAAREAQFGTPEDILARWRADFKAQNGRDPTPDEIAAKRGEVKEGDRGGPRVADVRLGREDELYGKLRDEWQAKQRAEGKPDEVTASVEARIRAQAHSAISGRGQGPMEPTLDEPTLARMADQVLAGQVSQLAGLGQGNAGAANRAALQNKITERASALGTEMGIPADRMGEFLAIKAAEYSGIIAGERTLGIRTAQLGLAAQEALLLMPAVLTASENVPRTELTDINRLINAGNTRTGDTNTVRLGIAINSFINVYARAINPNGVATVSDKEHARELLAPYWTKGQIREGLDQLKIEIDAAQRAPARVRQEFREGAATRVAPVDHGTPAAAAAPAAAPPPVPSALQGIPLTGWSPSMQRFYGEDGRMFDRNGKPVQ